MKHKEPDDVIKWREAKEYYLNNEPENCHTCDYYLNNGLCRKFGVAPPEEFAATHKECASWMPPIPF